MPGYTPVSYSLWLSQSGICGHQHPQKWTKVGSHIHSRHLLPSFPNPHLFLSSSLSPTPFDACYTGYKITAIGYLYPTLCIRSSYMLKPVKSVIMICISQNHIVGSPRNPLYLGFLFAHEKCMYFKGQSSMCINHLINFVRWETIYFLHCLSPHRSLISFIHSFILYLPYIQNFTVQGWNDEIKENVNGEET